MGRARTKLTFEDINTLATLIAQGRVKGPTYGVQQCWSLEVKRDEVTQPISVTTTGAHEPNQNTFSDRLRSGDVVENQDLARSRSREVM